MGDVWSISLLLLGLAVLAVGLRLATGNKPWSDSPVKPSSPPAGPGAEGMKVTDPGDITPGPEDEGQGDRQKPGE